MICLISSSGNIVLDVLEMSLFMRVRVEEDEFQFFGNGFRSLENRKALLHVFS